MLRSAGAEGRGKRNCLKGLRAGGGGGDDRQGEREGWGGAWVGGGAETKEEGGAKGGGWSCRPELLRANWLERDSLPEASSGRAQVACLYLACLISLKEIHMTKSYRSLTLLN